MKRIAQGRSSRSACLLSAPASLPDGTWCPWWWRYKCSLVTWRKFKKPFEQPPPNSMIEFAHLDKGLSLEVDYSSDRAGSLTRRATGRVYVRLSTCTVADLTRSSAPGCSSEIFPTGHKARGSWGSTIITTSPICRFSLSFFISVELGD